MNTIGNILSRINWKVRRKNLVFIVGVAMAVFTPLLAYYGLTAADITTWAGLWNLITSAVKNPFVLLMVAQSVFNAIVDPTTYGIGDSNQARGYDEPKKG